MPPIKPLNTNFGCVSLVGTASVPSVTPPDATGRACWGFAFGNLLGSSPGWPSSVPCPVATITARQRLSVTSVSLSSG